MLKKFAHLFVMTLCLALTAGCGAKSRLATPEDLLQEMAGRWEVDVDASMQVDSGIRDRVNNYGKEKIVRDLGQIGFDINLQARKLDFYMSREALLQSEPFVVAPETPEDTAAREKGIREVRLNFDGKGREFFYVLRYNADGKLHVSSQDGPVGVFSRLKE